MPYRILFLLSLCTLTLFSQDQPQLSFPTQAPQKDTLVAQDTLSYNSWTGRYKLQGEKLKSKEVEALFKEDSAFAATYKTTKMLDATALTIGVTAITIELFGFVALLTQEDVNFAPYAVIGISGVLLMIPFMASSEEKKKQLVTRYNNRIITQKAGVDTYNASPKLHYAVTYHF